MIQLIEHQLPEEAARIYQIFQRSYPFEGRLLGVLDKDFPPLQRTAGMIAKSETIFYGYFQEGLLAGVMELTLSGVVRINSFVVDPNYFKKGIGSKMMQLVLKEFEASQYIVETGKQNVPAISLYEKFGF
jgi:ribosomal protein S18 acetylase RimI-like enzyme